MAIESCGYANITLRRNRLSAPSAVLRPQNIHANLIVGVKLYNFTRISCYLDYHISKEANQGTDYLPFTRLETYGVE